MDSYLEEYRARGLSPQSAAHTASRLERWGRWLKHRRPRVAIERIDADLIQRYLASRMNWSGGNGRFPRFD